MKAHAQAMVLAAFAADSFALGTHWIYDTEKIEQQFGRITDLLPPHEGSYHPGKNVGDFTHYGDQSFHLLEHLDAHQGKYNATLYANEWQDFMTSYQGYADHATKETLQNMVSDGYTSDHTTTLGGSGSTDLGGPARIAPLIYSYRENLEEMLTAVKTQISLSHAGPGVIEGGLFLASSCYEILQGATPKEAMTKSMVHLVNCRKLHDQILLCLQPTGVETREQIKIFGQMCSIDSALPGAMYTVLKNEDNLEQALIENVMAGGESAARGMAIGMLLGAHLGKSKLPANWLVKLKKYQEIITILQDLP